MRPRLHTAVAVVLLLGLLAGITLALHRALEATRVEAARVRQQEALEAAAAGLEHLADAATEAAQRLAALDWVGRAADPATDPAARLEAFAQIDRHLASLARDDRLLRVLAVTFQEPAGRRALFGYDRSGRPREAAPPIVAAARRASGAVVLDLSAGPRGPGLQAAVARDALDLVLVVELDAGPALAQCAQAAAPGRWALRDGVRLLWPLGAAGPAPPPGPPTRSGRRVVVQGDELAAAVRVLRSRRRPWELVARVPLLGGAPVVPLALGAISLLLVGVLGLRGARAAFLQRSLAETEETERELAGTLDAITDVLLVVDAELTVVRANRGAREALGWEPVGRPYADVLAVRCGEASPGELAALRELFSRGEPRQLDLEGAQDRVWQVAHYPVFAPDLTVRGVVEHARDVTHNRLLRAQLVQSEKLSTLGEMAAGIAHEINNPIGVVSMFAQLLQEEIREALGDEAPALDKARLIEEQAVSVAEIVQGLLRFSRKSEGLRQPFDPGRAVARALTIVRHQKMLQGVDVVEHLAADLPAVVGDEGQVAQVVLNLIVNASHAMEGQGTLTLAARAQGPADPPPPGRAFGQADAAERRVHLTIGDTGRGIPPARLERIFEPFFTTKPVGQGTGLGLSVGFAIVRDHGGCIWVHSEEGAGTTFTLDLPASA